MPAQKTRRLAAGRILEKVNRSAVQFGENIFENARRRHCRLLLPSSAFARHNQPSDAVRLPNSRPWRATLILDNLIHSKNSFLKQRGARVEPGAGQVNLAQGRSGSSGKARKAKTRQHWRKNGQEQWQ
jgi:hypothetical protein